MEYPKRGEIWQVFFDPAIGGEIRKSRPALIVSNDYHNQRMRTVTVLPITDRGEFVFPVEVFLSQKTPGLMKDSKIKSHQIRTIDKSRMSRLLGTIPEELWKDIEKSLKIHLGMF